MTPASRVAWSCALWAAMGVAAHGGLPGKGAAQGGPEREAHRVAGGVYWAYAVAESQDEGYVLRFDGKELSVTETVRVGLLPAETEALKAGAPVFSAEGDQVGEVEGVLMDEQANRVSHFVIEEGFFFTNRKLVPVSWVRTVAQDEIHLGVGSKTLDSLPEYQP